ncbi:AfsR/SARP family transcriptional regulator [Streptomyces catenulae]|uniref:BTAD domain-containing putative transcriptional regulator n=1 Tax=Streptomyces catenulae TaxID=66875 RepID=A0ABV2YWK5_9ACTN|nr:BTAD domain-containing putative transcriptional regulator [Streptomyces catenulae]
MVELLLLGPLELWHDGRQWPIGSPKARHVLASLLYAQGEPVGVETLLDRVWGEEDETLDSPVATLQSYLSRLRTTLTRTVGDRARIDLVSPRRYRLTVADPDDVDLSRLRRIRAEARAAQAHGDREAAVAHLRRAQALWRGEPLAEFPGAWAAAVGARLTEDRRSLQEERIRLELELGRHTDLIGELRDLVAENPLAQRAVAALMLALYRSGRDGEALELYAATRRHLHDQLGIDPGADLRTLQRRILAQDATLDAPPPPPAPPTARLGQTPGAPPRTGGSSTLPRDTKDFTGRTGELRTLLATPPPEGHTTALPLTVVHGMPGVGKTALVVHAAHRLRTSYPDGLLYVDLRAYSDQPAYEPAEALTFLLHSAGVPDPLPDTFDERVACWREWTAHRRVLVVLDNARDADQILPLLPGAASCRAIVASRNRLTELHSATSLLLHELSLSEASALFTRVAGRGRSSDAALRRILRIFGGHPLTLQLLAGRLRHRDTWDLEYVAGRLAHADDPLDEIGERVTAAFQLSFADLRPAARRLFRYAALHPGPDITVDAAAALCTAPPDEIRRAAEELLDRHLIEEPIRDRYQLHDLSRAFGRRMCRMEVPRYARRQAMGGLLSYYLTAADRAERAAHPGRRWSLALDRESPYAPDFAATGDGAADRAAVWLTVERANLLAAARTAAAEFPEFATLFPLALLHSLKLWGIGEAAAELLAVAVTALRGTDDRATLARSLVARADVLAQSDSVQALSCASEAYALFETLGDDQGRADASLQTGRAHLAAGRSDACGDALERARELYRVTGDRYGVAESLNVQGAGLIFGADYPRAMRCFVEMLHIQSGLGDLHGQAKALNNMGEIHFHEGRREQALHHYEQSLKLVRRFGGAREATILDNNLGDVHLGMNRLDQAQAFFRRALSRNRARGDAVGELNSLIGLGRTHAAAGRTEEAMRHLRTAEELALRLGNVYERQRAMVGRADAHRLAGESATALETYDRARRLAEDFDLRRGIADALAGIARTHLQLHDKETARSYAERALMLFHRLGARGEADTLRHLLGRRQTPTPGPAPHHREPLADGA